VEIHQNFPWKAGGSKAENQHTLNESLSNINQSSIPLMKFSKVTKKAQGLKKMTKKSPVIFLHHQMQIGRVATPVGSWAVGSNYWHPTIHWLQGVKRDFKD